jgi:hypothetical protein
MLAHVVPAYIKSQAHEGWRLRQLAEAADWTDKVGSRTLLEKIHHSHKIDKTDDAIRKLGEGLEGEEGFTTKSSLEQRSI